MDSPIEVVPRFCAAWSDNVGAAELAAFFTQPDGIGLGIAHFGRLWRRASGGRRRSGTRPRAATPLRDGDFRTAHQPELPAPRMRVKAPMESSRTPRGDPVTTTLSTFIAPLEPEFR
jgi:hypothetical protein